MVFLIILRIFPHMIMLVTTTLHTAKKHLERISFMHCLVNTRKFVLRWNPSLVKMLSVCQSMCIAMMKSMHEMHCTILAVEKHRRHCYNTLQLTWKMTIIQYEVMAWTGLHMVWLGGWLKNRPVQYTGNMVKQVKYVEPQKDIAVIAIMIHLSIQVCLGISM